MKKLIAIIIFLPVLIFLRGCEHDVVIDGDDGGIKGSGNIVSENRTVDECTGVNIINYGTVYITQDNTQSIRVEADDNIIHKVITKKENGILETGLEDGEYSNVTLKIYVSLKEIKDITITGAGNIEAKEDLQCDDLTGKIDGAGNILLHGNCNSFKAVIIGTGNINAFALKSVNCDARVVGAGICSVYVTNKLTALVSGTGSIIYDGNPVEVQSTISGIGSIVSK